MNKEQMVANIGDDKEEMAAKIATVGGVAERISSSKLHFTTSDLNQLQPYTIF